MVNRFAELFYWSRTSFYYLEVSVLLPYRFDPGNTIIDSPRWSVETLQSATVATHCLALRVEPRRQSMNTRFD
jgi:hypothetical protein